MYITNLQKTKPAATPANLEADQIPVSVQWLLGEPEGAPNYELRYLSFPVGAYTVYHDHQWEHEVFVVKGTGKVKTEQGETAIKANDAVLLLPNEPHQIINTSLEETLDIICVVPKGTRTFSCQCG
ncbi:cupin domain-containing protein [Sporomusa sp. KB1]|jgi:quercetin dioxygenase-like cupin family protein|uniref:cupin domain-containing protein n=1 Tax=Sporomusa sp. KB1 TaxID=943346 RepID=UPI00119F6675|nr:cupin domain-containing protein [Sporomusa sp. KB1]TWH46072.1 quercetin dioxygenase-like cupin family protein [Sporomusa sp. KB1]